MSTELSFDAKKNGLATDLVNKLPNPTNMFRVESDKLL